MASRELFDDLTLVVRLNQHIQQVASAALPPEHSAGGRNAHATASPAPRQSSFKVLAALEAVATDDPRQDAQFEHQREGFAVAGPAGLPFHLQGDRELNEGSALARRRALRFSEPLRAKVAFLWDVARGDKPVGREQQPLDASAVEMSEGDYMALMLLVFKVLRDDFTLELAHRQIGCDWAVDSRHGQALGFEQFFSALFELVDVWTCDVEERSYVRFLELLLRRVTVRVVVFLDGDTLKLALSDNFDEAVVAKAIPLRTIPRFASVARVLAPSGVRTVGELASADPAMVERERVDYLARTGTASGRIGQELHELLAMFRQLAQTFDHADYRYSVRDHTLLRTRWPSDGGDDLRPVAHPSGPGSGGHSDGEGVSTISLQPTASGPAIGSDGPSAVESAPTPTPPPGGRKRLNSIHDVSVADPDLVTALKTSFLIEKRISLERQTDAAAVREELAKFGVEAAREMGEDAARRQYAALYDLLVVRDGDDLTALARAMMQQIREALAAHGIAVDDDADAEAAYDQFYGAVVAGSGEAIVADAQQWVRRTVAAGAAGEFVQRDYHELRPVDEVALLGTQPGDDEFLALMATDDPGEAEAEAEEAAGRRLSSSPIQRKPSQLALGAKSSRRALPVDDAPLLSQPPLPPTDKRASRTSGKRADDRDGEEEGGEHGQRHGKERASSKHKRGRRRKRRPSDPRHASERSDDEPEAGEAADSELDEHVADPRSQTAGGGVCQAGTEAPSGSSDNGSSERDQLASTADAIHSEERVSASDDERAGSSSGLGEGRGRQQSAAATAGTVEASMGDGDEDEVELSQRRSEIVSRPPRADPLESDRGLGEAVGYYADIDEREREREPQSVDFGFDAAAEPVQDEPRPEPARPAELPPKVPEIAVGGVASGASAAAVGRYIQLLGLGSVTTTTDEASLLELLASDAGRDTDLVCFDVGSELDAARERLLAIQARVGRRVILFGGSSEPDGPRGHLEAVVSECLAAGALFFATLPVDFPLLRERIYGFLEASTRPYILRSRKPAGRAAAALQSASRTIGAAGLFSLQDVEPSRKLSMASAAVAHSGKGGLRKLSVAIPGLLPSLVPGSSGRRLSAKAAEEARAPELTPSMPLTPRSLKAHKRSPRLSAALNKLIR